MDYYDKAVEYLENHPGQISRAWVKQDTHVAGRLFSFICPTREPGVMNSDGKEVGCPTMIRHCPHLYGAYTPELTDMIVADDGIPLDNTNIPVSSLRAFANVQRIADKALNRTAPVWPEEVPA